MGSLTGVTFIDWRVASGGARIGLSAAVVVAGILMGIFLAETERVSNGVTLRNKSNGWGLTNPKRRVKHSEVEVFRPDSIKLRAQL